MIPCVYATTQNIPTLDGKTTVRKIGCTADGKGLEKRLSFGTTFLPVKLEGEYMIVGFNADKYNVERCLKNKLTKFHYSCTGSTELYKVSSITLLKHMKDVAKKFEAKVIKA